MSQILYRPPQLNKDAIQYVTIAESNPDSPRNDTANVVELPDGSLLVVWHRYGKSREGGSDYGKADIACRISRDRGATWADERVIVTRDPEDLNIQAPAVCLLPTGELLLTALRAHSNASSSMCLFRSNDLGKTWSDAGAIWNRSTGQWLQGGTSSIVQLPGGKLLVPFHGGSGTQWQQHNTVGIWASTDQGHTWRRTPACVDLPMRGAMEASVAPLPSGRLIMSLRSQLGSVFMCESRDEGETWSLPWCSGLTAPESCTCLRRIGNSDWLMLIWNGLDHYDPKHHHYGRRTPLTIAVSPDAGRTWLRIGNLEDNDNEEYTNLNCTFTSSGDAVITYWIVSPAFDRANLTMSNLKTAIIPRSYWDSVIL
ncbi:MAG: sialidase family protein [Candidatus Methylacidiphilales bacterium]